jgi:hypothetical protein
MLQPAASLAGPDQAAAGGVRRDDLGRRKLGTRWMAKANLSPEFIAIPKIQARLPLIQIVANQLTWCRGN